ncbi:MAG: FecR family protein [Myxococcaceae bacterium]|nr:FecR family protein [Myxococcaceae bacterium]
MSHLEHETAWALARGQRTQAEVAQDRAHLTECAQCRAQQTKVEAAVALLEPRQVPPLSSERAAAMRRALVAHAAQESAPWWRAWLSPTRWIPLVSATGLVLFVVTQLAAPRVEPMLRATVTTQALAQVNGAAVEPEQAVAEGASLRTSQGGALALKLADATAVALAADTRLTVRRLRPREVSFTLEAGEVTIDAPHDPTRALRVQAGGLEVVDVGTSFTVKQSDGAVRVAVTSGEVELRGAGSPQRLTAGHAARFENGVLREDAVALGVNPDVAPVPAPAPLPVPAPVAPSPPSPPSPAAVRPPPPAPVPAAPVPVPNAPVPVNAPEPEPEVHEEAWAPLPPGAAASKPPAVSPPPPPPTTPAAPPATAPAPSKTNRAIGADEVTVTAAEQRLKSLATGVTQSFTTSARELRAKELHRLAESGDCNQVVLRANAWLTETPTADPAEPRWRRAVMVDQAKCLTKLGRKDEADQVRANLPP